MLLTMLLRVVTASLSEVRVGFHPRTHPRTLDVVSLGSMAKSWGEVVDVWAARGRRGNVGDVVEACGTSRGCP